MVIGDLGVYCLDKALLWMKGSWDLAQGLV